MANNVQIEKLKGRENFDTWKILAKSYLVIKGLWKCCEERADESLTDKDLKAKSELILLVEPVNFSYVAEAETAYDAWKNLCNVFEDNGLTRKVIVLQQLIKTKGLSVHGGICEQHDDFMDKSKKGWVQHRQ